MKLLTLAVAMVLAGRVLQAENLPVWPAHWMCAEAEAIVVGERIGANRVKIHEWLSLPPDEESPKKEIEIMGLDQHSRVVRSGSLRPGEGLPGKGLKTQRFVCFLDRKGTSWHSLATTRMGSSGLVWIEEGRCYRYEQAENPGPLRLAPYRACPSEKELRAEIQKGLSHRNEWREALTIAHPHEKAIVLSAYLLARTSPEGSHGTYRQRVRRVLPKLGRHAVNEVLELFRTAQPEDRFGDAVLVLHDLGSTARPAVPHLVALLDKPKQVNPVRILEALGRIGDASVAQKILPYLNNEALQIRAEVATAMARFRYQDSAPAIVEALPKKVDQADAYHVYAMLLALRELDPGTAREATKRFVNEPAMQHVQNLLEPLLGE